MNVSRPEGQNVECKLEGLDKGKRTYMAYLPLFNSVTKLEIRRRGHVRRARLFYLRKLSGKKARLRSKVRDIAALMARPEEVGTAEETIAAEAHAPEEQTPEPEKSE